MTDRWKKLSLVLFIYLKKKKKNLSRGNTERTNSLKILCLMFVYVCSVLSEFVSGLIL